MPFAILATRFSFQQPLITAIHPNRSQRRGDQNAQNCYGEHDLSAGEAHGHWDGADGGLDGCFGQVGNGAEQLFFCGQVGSGYAEGDTEGADLHPLLNQKAIDAVFHKGENPLIDSYSAFFDNEHRQKTALDEWLRHHGIKELVIMGLATDYCVKFTVLDALSLGYTVNVIIDGCRGVNLNQQDSAQAFMEMAAEGATLFTLDDWLETQR